MRRDHRHPADAVILNAAGVDRRNRRAVGMPEQEATAKADFVEQLWQNVERLDVHVVERTRQLDPGRAAPAGPVRSRNSGRANTPTRRPRWRLAAGPENLPTTQPIRGLRAAGRWSA